MAQAYAYIRHSTKRQGREDKDSVTRQKASIRQLAKQYNVEVPDEHFYYENGVSAFSGKNRTHGKLKELIDQINDLRIRPGDIVFVESIDRLSRQRLLQAKELVNGILEKGIVLVTTIDNHRYERATAENGIDDFTQDVLLSVIAKRAHDESNTKSIRRKSAWTSAKLAAEKSQKPFNASRPPFGVQYNPSTNRFESHPVESLELVRIFESLKLQGVISTIKEVNKTSEIRWTQNRIKDLFRTKYPLGYLYSQKKVDGKFVLDKMIEGYYPQLVSFQLFEEARIAMSKRKVERQSGRVAEGNVNILRHIAMCGYCNTSLFFMNNSTTKGGRYFYLNCKNNFETSSKCKNRFRYDLAVKVLFDIIKQSEYLSKFANAETIQSLSEEQRFEMESEFTKYYVENHQQAFLKANPDAEIYDLLKHARKVTKSAVILSEQFSKIMNSSAEDIDVKNQRFLIEAEILKEKHRIESFNNSITRLDLSVDDIPDVLVIGIVEAKRKISKYEEELEKLTVLSSSKSEIQIKTLAEFLRLFKTEDGRLKIVSFLNAHGFQFRFAFDKERKIITTGIFLKSLMDAPDKGSVAKLLKEENRQKVKMTSETYYKEIATVETYYEAKADILEDYGFANLGIEMSITT